MAVAMLAVAAAGPALSEAEGAAWAAGPSDPLRVNSGTPAVQNGPVPGASAGGQGDVLSRVLGNGLQVLVLEDHAAPLVCSYIWYRAGLRTEGPGEAGLTHFLEHMAFKGTARLTGREMDRLVTQNGGYLNGFTSMDFTAFVETLPREALDVAFDIESERMSKCLLSQEDIESERGVVISEFEGAENDPSFLLRSRVTEAQFPDQPYGRMVIGRKADLRALTREKVVSYYDRYYCPSNALLVVVGDVKADEVFAKAERYFGAIPRGNPGAPAPNPGRGTAGEKRVKLEMPGRTSYVQMMYGVPAIDHPDHIALEVLQNILSGGRTSRLYRALVDTGIAADAGGWDYENPQPTAFGFELSLRPSVAHEKAEQALGEVIGALKEELVSDRELTKAKNQTKANFIYAADGVTKLAQQIGQYSLIYSLDYLRTFPAKVDAVTAEDIRRVVRTYFVPENRTVGWLIAAGEGGGAAVGPPPSDVRRSRHLEEMRFAPDAAALAPIPIPAGITGAPPIHEVKLPNGMQVILQQNHAAPFVSIFANVMAGPVFEPEEKAGLAAFCSEMLSRGTQKRTWAQIREALEFVAAQVGFGIGTQVATVSGQCLTADLPLLLEATAEQLMLPAFPPEEVEKVRSEIIAAQQRRDEDTYQLAEMELLAHLYPSGHPLHHPSLGNRETVSGITRDDLVAFHGKWYRPENVILAIVGDIQPAQVAELVSNAFGSWPQVGEPARPQLPPVPVPTKPETVRVPVPNKTQVDIALGFPGLSRRDPDFYKADLMDYLLGRGFMSRLNMRIRDELGLAYYVMSAYYAYWGPGPWALHMGVNPANADKAVAAAVEEVTRIQKETPADEEVKLWKDYVTGTVARQMETFSGIGQTLVLSAFYDLGLYFPYEYPGILRAITPEQVEDAARKYLHPDGYVAVLAGPVAGAPAASRARAAEGAPAAK
jgi:zinc protease